MGKKYYLNLIPKTQYNVTYGIKEKPVAFYLLWTKQKQHTFAIYLQNNQTYGRQNK